MRLTVLVADSAQVDPRGKVHALGLGWTHVPFPTPPLAIILFMDWAQTETPSLFDVVIRLRSETGEPVMADGDQQFEITANGHVDRLTDSAEGDTNRVPFVVQLGPGLPIKPGRYVLESTVTTGGESVTVEERFRVRQQE